MMTTRGLLTGYRDIQAISFPAATPENLDGDFFHEAGGFAVYAKSAGDIIVRGVGGQADLTFTFGNDGGMVRFGDSAPLICSVIRQTGTTVNTVDIQIGLF